MKNFSVRILLAPAITFLVFVLASASQAQQADEDPAPATPRQQPSTPKPQAQQNREAQQPSPKVETQEALAFTGHVVQEQDQLVLKDPVTKMSYNLDDQSKARPYLGKQVKVIGKLEMKSNTIHIVSFDQTVALLYLGAWSTCGLTSSLSFLLQV